MTRHQVQEVGLIRGALGGLLAGAVFLGFEMWFAVSQGDPLSGPLDMIAALLLGVGIEVKGLAAATLGLTTHFVLSAAYGAIFSLLLPRFRTSGQLVTAGALYGLILYVGNLPLLILTGLLTVNHPFYLLAHIAFGIVLAWCLLGLGAWKAFASASTGIPTQPKPPVRLVVVRGGLSGTVNRSRTSRRGVRRGS